MNIKFFDTPCIKSHPKKTFIYNIKIGELDLFNIKTSLHTYVNIRSGALFYNKIGNFTSTGVRHRDSVMSRKG